MGWTCEHCGKVNTPQYSAPIFHFICHQFEHHHASPCGSHSAQKSKVGWTSAVMLVTCRKCVKWIEDYRKTNGKDPESRDCRGGL